MSAAAMTPPAGSVVAANTAPMPSPATSAINTRTVSDTFLRILLAKRARAVTLSQNLLVDLAGGTQRDFLDEQHVVG
jgi:hypothetical protein